MEITYNVKNIKPYDYKPFLSVKQTKYEPNVKINDIGYKYYTLIMYDPDAIHGTHLHWIVTNITNNNIKQGNVILKYSGPRPPDAKKHRYVFELYGSNEKLNDKNVYFDSRNVTLEQGKEILGIQTQYPLIQYIFISEREREREKKKGGTTKRKKKKGKRQRKTRKNNNNKKKNK